MFDRIDLNEVAAAVAAMGADGWLIYDFHGLNPVADRVVGPSGMVTRRSFVWLPATGDPVAVTHRIELQTMEGFPGRLVPYSTWDELAAALNDLVDGKTAAMEISRSDAVPYLDRVPAGVVELVQEAGARIVESADLVTRFAAVWTKSELEDHLEASEIIAEVAKTNIRNALAEIGKITEHELQTRVVGDLEGAGLTVDDPPIVGFGVGSSLPHYEPSASRPVVLEANQVLLLDLWAGKSLQTPFADQTWMGFSGSEVPAQVALVWEAVKGARDAVLAELAVSHGSKQLTGFDLDDIARRFISNRGFGDAFTHRTGHSIDVELHGSGPHLDSYETRDRRVLMNGIGFSVEPGVYLEGQFGVRSEVNVYLGPEGPTVTPRELQQELILAD